MVWHYCYCLLLYESLFLAYGLIWFHFWILPVGTEKAAGSPHQVDRRIDPCRQNSVSLLPPPKGVEDLRVVAGYGNVNTFTYSQLSAATKNFRPDQILGNGGFGIVYRGFLDENIKPGFKSTQVAVKKLNPEGVQGDKEWLVFSLLWYFLNYFTDEYFHFV